MLAFSGDDDVWVFINGKLAVHIGGLHPKQAQSVTLGVQKSAELGLTLGKVYELTLFHAERAPDKVELQAHPHGLSEQHQQM